MAITTAASTVVAGTRGRVRPAGRVAVSVMGRADATALLRQSTPVGVVDFSSRLGSRFAARSRALRTRRVLELDYRDFRRRYGELLDSVPIEATGAALLASLSYSPFQLKLEGMFAKSFQLQGWSRWLRSRRTRGCRSATSSCSGYGASSARATT